MPSFKESFIKYLESKGLTYEQWRKQRFGKEHTATESSGTVYKRCHQIRRRDESIKGNPPR